MRICVIMPAHNEAKAIGDLIKSINPYVGDVLIVDDGSTDETERISREAGASVIGFKKNAGKGAALKAGFDYALQNNYDAVITMDADGQHSPKDILSIIDNASSSEVGIVVGNRMANPEAMPAIRFATNLAMSLIISAICRQNIPDTQCGFRLVKCNVLKAIRLVSLNYEIESEILIRASRTGFKIKSAPIKSIYEGQTSLINPIVDTWRFFAMLFRALM
ncbi:MAG: glycosyltransferase family 2 protein [Candidatus Omnitrophica bacterium]|nr:glycosyltransferase family 2 protein [Candidatus Omnitrophota bacterium]